MEKIKLKNKGSVSVEASLIMPIFVVAMVSIYCMICCKMTEEILYEAFAQCCEYSAEMAYLNHTGIVTSTIKLEDYIDDEDMVSHWIDGGSSGISFLGSIDDTSNNHMYLYASYTLKVDLPLVSTLKKKKTVLITQKDYVGYTSDTNDDENSTDQYVYVTENRDVYHTTRNCSYLLLSIKSKSLTYAKENGYEACQYCGKKAGNTVYITEYGDKYHSNRNCSALKRTVYRVKKSEVSDLSECSRCAGK